MQRASSLTDLLIRTSGPSCHADKETTCSKLGIVAEPMLGRLIYRGNNAVQLFSTSWLPKLHTTYRKTVHASTGDGHIVSGGTFGRARLSGCAGLAGYSSPCVPTYDVARQSGRTSRNRALSVAVRGVIGLSRRSLPQ